MVIPHHHSRPADYFKCVICALDGIFRQFEEQRMAVHTKAGEGVQIERKAPVLAINIICLVTSVAIPAVLLLNHTL